MRLFKKEIQSIIAIVLYFGSMLLLIEWILPLEQVTDTGESYAFIIYILICFLITTTYLPSWIISLVKFFSLLIIIDVVFISEPMFTREWFSFILSDIQSNISTVLSQQWYDLTPLFRTLLFLILLWMMSYLLFYWFVIRKKPLTFILITLIYLTVLDTFTVFEAQYAIIRAFIISVILLASAHFHRILEKEKLTLPKLRNLTKWVVPLLTVVMFSTVIGYAAPKYDPIWPDPVPFLKSASKNAGDRLGFGPSGPQRIGYDSNDERLGGGFTWDESTVFYAEANSPQYWKVETKDVYTGKGWIRSNDGEIIRSSGEAYDLMEYGEVVEFRDAQGRLKFVNPGKLDKIPYMYGTEYFALFEQHSIEYNRETGEVKVVTEEGYPLPLMTGQGEFYEYNAKRPFFPTNRMREVPAKNQDPEMEQYLQLPDTLPDRVRELAEEIVSGHNNRFDQVKAIERYFRENGFKYEVENVPLPNDDEDYVDQFLFETQYGYCDNFSTAMVVMLRSVDIPARWVKGFTGGDRLPTTQDVFTDTQLGVYEVKNRNAHSWVEVYFPNVGWVPFEPTVGFTNQSSFVLGDELDLNPDDEEREEEEKLEQPDEEEKKEEEKDETEAVAGKSNQYYYFVGGIIFVVGLAILLFYIYRFRYQLLSKWKRQRLIQKKDVDSFSEAYQFLIKILSSKGYPIKSGQTLREYANEIDQYFGNGEMIQLTNYYERAIYRNDNITKEFKDIYQLWDKMVNKLT